jgi:hypothetical protein
MALAINLSGRNIALSWPTNATGYQLQSSLLLGSSATWTAVTNTPVISGTNYSVTLPATNHCVFFQLQSTN